MIEFGVRTLSPIFLESSIISSHQTSSKLAIFISQRTLDRKSHQLNRSYPPRSSNTNHPIHLPPHSTRQRRNSSAHLLAPVLLLRWEDHPYFIRQQERGLLTAYHDGQCSDVPIFAGVYDNDCGEAENITGRVWLVTGGNPCQNLKRGGIHNNQSSFRPNWMNIILL